MLPVLEKPFVGCGRLGGGGVVIENAYQSDIQTGKRWPYSALNCECTGMFYPCGQSTWSVCAVGSTRLRTSGLHPPSRGHGRANLEACL